jgi:hypothetical protein
MVIHSCVSEEGRTEKTEGWKEKWCAGRVLCWERPALHCCICRSGSASFSSAPTSGQVGDVCMNSMCSM